MKRGYMVSVHYSNSSLDIYLNSSAASLLLLLQGLDAAPDVISLSVHSTLQVPTLHKISKLTRTDLGFESGTLKKIK